MPGYEPTPLVDLPSIADRCGVGRVLVKCEADRFGLPAFKILGASWATYRLLGERHALRHGVPAPTGSFDELRAAFASDDVTLVTATDGNHGRAVARAAAWFGAGADIYVPAGTVDARVSAIESEGARVTVVDGDYDAAVALAASTAGPDRLVVSDTSWPGYDRVPRWIAEGYRTLFVELDEQLADAALAPEPDAILVPVGIGALMVAALDRFSTGAPHGPARISVEPVGADCLLQSLAAGEPVTTPGPHRSMMAGMNCGTVSMVAWPIMRARTDWAIALDDEPVAATMRLLADAGIVAGETGAGALAALVALADEPDGVATIGLGPESTVVALCTEGATDPVNYARVVG